MLEKMELWTTFGEKRRRSAFRVDSGAGVFIGRTSNSNCAQALRFAPRQIDWLQTGIAGSSPCRQVKKKSSMHPSFWNVSHIAIEAALRDYNWGSLV